MTEPSTSRVDERGVAVVRRLVRSDLLVAAVLVVVAAVAVAVGVPALARTASVVAAALLLGRVVWERSRRGGWELLASGLGGALAAAVVGGVLLDRLPSGIDRGGWAGVLALCGLGLVAVAARRPVVRRAAVPRLPAVVFGAAATAVVAVALVAAVLASRATESAPLQMWLTDAEDGTAASVSIRSPGPGGPYDLWLEPEGGEPELLTSGLTLPADEVVSVPLPPVEERTVVVLRVPGETDPVRSVTAEPED